MPLGFATFDALLAGRALLGRSQAYKLIAIVERVSREDALSLGEEKAYAIARLVAATPADDTVTSVLDQGVAVGKKRRAVAKMSRREIDATRRAVSRKGHTEPAENEARSVARSAQATLRKKGVRATARAEKRAGKWYAVLTIPVAEVALVVRER